MKKYLLLVILLMSSLAWAGSTTVVVGQVSSGAGGGEASCTSCNSSTDSSIEEDANATTGSNHKDIWIARPFTIAATRCITGAWFTSFDSGNSSGATVEIYTDSAGSPGSIVGTGYTCTVANLADASSDYEYLFASTQTLSAGTYWQVMKMPFNSFYRYGTVGDKVWKTSTNSGSSWSAAETYTFRGGVLGCVPE